MNINKSSWHYRLLDRLDMINWRGENLCPYFWKVVIATVLLPAIALALLWTVTLPLWGLFFGAPLVLIVVVGLADIAGLIWLLVVLVSERQDEEIRVGSREAPVNLYKAPSLFRLWLRARHRQVCPLIDFVED